MLNHPAFAQSDPTPTGKHDPDSARGEFDEILTLAREAGMLITLDGRSTRASPGPSHRSGVSPKPFARPGSAELEIARSSLRDLLGTPA
jgi:hypothetical protein